METSYFITKKDIIGLKTKLDKKDEDINQLYPSGNTFLSTAIAKGFDEGAILLIEHGINVSLLNNKGDSALNIAAEHNAYNAAKLNIEKDNSTVNVPDSFGNIPLWTAIVQAMRKIDIDYRMIDLLIENGSNIYHQNKNKQTCIFLIERRERLEILQHIKDKFPDKIKK